jgi:hypothetical protein
MSNWDINLALNNVYEQQQFQQANSFRSSKTYTQNIKALFDKYKGNGIAIQPSADIDRK